MSIRPFRSLTTVALSALAFAAACSDPITQPGSSLRPDEPHLTVASTSVATFTLNPTVTNVYQSVEGHRIVIPAYSICKVGTAYGPAHWNTPCTAETAPIAFTVSTYTSADGRPGLTVKPDVRFSPTKTVTAYIKDGAAANRFGSVIEYCTITGCENEGRADADMVTYRDAGAGIVYRRLKHFSGYNVVFGRSCDNPDPETGECPSTDGLTARSPMAPITPSLFAGYITTTARDGR